MSNKNEIKFMKKNVKIFIGTNKIQTESSQFNRSIFDVLFLRSTIVCGNTELCYLHFGNLGCCYVELGVWIGE